MKIVQEQRTSWPESLLNQYYPELKKEYGVDKGLNLLPYFTEVFRKALEEMNSNNSRYLILDLSQNGGGYSQIAVPALYLLYGDRCFSPEFEGSYIKRVSQLFLDKFNTNIDEYNKQNNSNVKIGDYTISDIVLPLNQNHFNKQKRIEYFNSLDKNNFGWKKFIKDLDGKALYTPKVIVLTGSQTASAAYHFLYNLYKAGDIIVIGVAPSQAGNTPMENTPFSLPATEIKGSISNAYQVFFPEDHKKAKLFEPDFSLNWSDFQKQGFSKHTELEIAIELIKNGMIE